MIRPSDGRLLYTNSFEDLVREFHCEACSYSGTYGMQVLANDTVLPAACPPANPRVTAFMLSADGVMLHVCSQTYSSWRDATGSIVYDATTDPLWALGANGWVLTKTRVINPQTMTTLTITGLPGVAYFLAVRWNAPDGFYAAIDTGPAHQLWRVATTGVAQLVGTYPPLPPAIQFPSGWRLDKAGRLFAIANDSSKSFIDVIVRRDVSLGASDIVYTESTNPLVKLHISGLVTGP